MYALHGPPIFLILSIAFFTSSQMEFTGGIMRYKISFVVYAILLVISSSSAFASVNVTITPDASTLGPLISFVDTSQYENDVAAHPEAFFNLNDKTLPYGFALANTIGYPNGKSLIKPFPSFEFGLSGGAAVYKYKRSGDFGKDNPKIPGMGANAAIHFGSGINDVSDITFKLLYSQNFYKPDKKLTKDNTKRDYEFKLTEMNMLSLGSKVRYNIIPGSSYGPGLFSIGGLTVGVAADYMKGNIDARGIYRDRRNVNFTVTDPLTYDTITRSILTESTIRGNTSLSWNIVSVTPELFTYLDLLYVFSFYTGPSASFNAGSVKIRTDARGETKNVNSIYSDGNILELIPADSTIATAEMNSTAKMKVPPVIPKWTLGVEINIFAFKIQIEGTTVLTSPTDSFSGQIGLRAQF